MRPYKLSGITNSFTDSVVKLYNKIPLPFNRRADERRNDIAKSYARQRCSCSRRRYSVIIRCAKEQKEEKELFQSQPQSGYAASTKCRAYSSYVWSLCLSFRLRWPAATDPSIFFSSLSTSGVRLEGNRVVFRNLYAPVKMLWGVAYSLNLWAILLLPL